MLDSQLINNSYSNGENKKDKIYFSNVFSKVNKSEKNKQYQNLQNNLISLSKDVRLLEDFVNKDKYGKNKKYTSAMKYKKFVARSNFLLNKKNNRLSSLLNVISNYIVTQNEKKKEESKKKNKLKSKESKRFTKSKDHYSIYKTEVDKSSNINSNILPKINLNLDKSSETNVESNINNINQSNTSSILPNIQNREPKHLYLFTENNEKKSRGTKKFTKRFLLPKNKVNIDNNTFIKEFPDIIDNQKQKSNINRYELSKSADKIVKIMQDKNQKIKNNINMNLEEQNLIDWEMKSKLKLARWKFGISEIEKYFVDLRAYGKPEEEELLKRKTFYDKFEELIDDIKQTKEEKAINKIKNKYEEKKDNKDEKNNEENDDLNMVDNVVNKHSEASKALEKVKIRRINEEKIRHKINNILVQSDLSRRAINRSTDKLYSKKNNQKLNDTINENKKSNKLKEKMGEKPEEDNEILKINKKEKEED